MHADLTGSDRARNILREWSAYKPLFVRVIPHDYKRVVEAQRANLAKGMSFEEAEMAAFEENVKDASRIHGK